MKNEYFNTDGPMEITMEDFELYKNLPVGITRSFQQLYSCWVNRYPTEGVARLCLRDLVRQRQYVDTDLAYYELRRNAVYLVCCHADAQDTGEKFAQTMATRPELVEELTEELLYALERVKDLNVTSLMEALFALEDAETREPLVDEETRKKLLPYYDEWRLGRVHGTRLKECTSYLLNQLGKQTTPDWLRDEFLKEINAEIERERAALPKEMPKGMYGAFGEVGKDLNFPILHAKIWDAIMDSRSSSRRAQAVEFLLGCPELEGHCFHGFEDDVKMMWVLARDPNLMETVVKLMKNCCVDSVFWETRKDCNKGKQRTLLYWMTGVLTMEMSLVDAEPIRCKIVEALKDTASGSDDE